MDGQLALVLGATGGVGGAIASALIEHGWSVRGLARDVPAAERGWPDDRGTISWAAGDAMNGADVIHAAAGTSVIVHAVNPPGYRQWDRLVLPMIDNSIAAARAAGGARIVLPGTVYNFDPATTPVVGEDSEQMPRSRKGRVRVEMEARLEAAARSGVPNLTLSGSLCTHSTAWRMRCKQTRQVLSSTVFGAAPTRPAAQPPWLSGKI